jgi:hypothetical protein
LGFGGPRGNEDSEVLLGVTVSRVIWGIRVLRDYQELLELLVSMEPLVFVG